MTLHTIASLCLGDTRHARMKRKDTEHVEVFTARFSVFDGS